MDTNTEFQSNQNSTTGMKLKPLTTGLLLPGTSPFFDPKDVRRQCISRFLAGCKYTASLAHLLNRLSCLSLLLITLPGFPFLFPDLDFPLPFLFPYLDLKFIIELLSTWYRTQ